MRTLGPQVSQWIHDNLPSPADPSQGFTFTAEQAAIMVRWYALDERDQFLYRRGMLQQAKGWGKSPFVAALCIAEFAGPVIYDGLDADRRPVGRHWGTGGSPASWVQIAANSEEQASSNVYSLIWEFLSLNHGKAASDLGIDQGRTRLYLKDHPAAKLEAVTSSYGAREGQRVTFAVFDETHLWTQTSGGHKLAQTIRRNAGKMGGRSLECSNSHELGLESVAEKTMADAEAGKPGILYVANRPTVVPEPEWSDADLRGVLRDVYGDARWVDLDRIVLEVRDPETPWEEALRYYFNTPASGLGAFVDPRRWAELARAGEEPPRGSRIALGFDGSVTTDATALVACDEAGKLYPIRIWEHPPGAKDWKVPRLEVLETVKRTFADYDVMRMLVDPWHWRTELEQWERDYGEEIVLDLATNSVARMSPALDRFRVAVSEGSVTHNGDRDLARHIANARLRASRGGHVLDEAGPRRYFDAAIAAVLAFEAAMTAPVKKNLEPVVRVGQTW